MGRSTLVYLHIETYHHTSLSNFLIVKLSDVSVPRGSDSIESYF